MDCRAGTGSGRAVVKAQSLLLAEQNARPLVVGKHGDQPRDLTFYCDTRNPWAARDVDDVGFGRLRLTTPYTPIFARGIPVENRRDVAGCGDTIGVVLGLLSCETQSAQFLYILGIYRGYTTSRGVPSPMLSYQHELLVSLFRGRTESTTVLLRGLDVDLPEYDEIHTESTSINDLQPAEYRADLVLFLVRRSRKVLGPGTHCRPWVVGPSNTPAITCLEDAEQNVELAVLSAVEHGHDSDKAIVERIARAATAACRSIDDERSRLYLDLISISLNNSAPEALEATMNSLGYEYQSDLARRYVAEGRAEGRIEAILGLLARRFGTLTETIQTRVRGARGAAPYCLVDEFAERMLTAQTLEQVFERSKR
jgi:hypothetical protein